MASNNYSSKVADHYNNVKQMPISQRSKSDIIELRKFNNAMKSLMHHLALKYISLNTQPYEMIRVLDLGCGKGGDLPKYLRNERVGLVVGVDIADVSIDQCKDRFKSMTRHNQRRLRGEFFVADLTREDIGKRLLELNCTEKFHIASSQFSIHYSFESFEQAVRYISNAADNLEGLGVFIGTYPDGPKLLKLARQSETPGIYEVDDILSVEFAPEDLRNPRPFGTRYHFKLKEVVNCPEFLVHPEILKALMESLGFVRTFDRSFEEHMKEVQKNDKNKFMEIFKAHKAFDFDFDRKEARLSEDMWSVASIYRCFCYRKRVI